MTPPTNHNDDWMVVTRGTRRKVAKPRYIKGSPSSADNDTKTKANEEAEAEPVKVCSQISSCSENLRKSQFYKTMKQSWESFPQEDDKEEEGITVNEIVCYGIGNFAQKSSHFSGPLWQLALALELQKLIVSNHPSPKDNRKTTMVYYDPLVTPVEWQLLQDYYHIQVLATNEKGIRSCRPLTSDHQNGKSNGNSELLPLPTTTLFFMPHCPKGLYENVLWANWDELQNNPCSICIVGNSLATYVERATTSNNSNPSCLELVQPFLQERLIVYSKKDVRDMPGYFEAAFNDTYLTWFEHHPRPNSNTELGSRSPKVVWPKRPEQPSQDGQNEVL